MSSSEKSVAAVLIESAIRVVGKREFLKTVESMFGMKKTTKVTKESTKEKKPRKPRTLKEVPKENRCCARVKGDISAVVGKRHYYESAQCSRGRVASSDLCAIHRNQSEKFGVLPDGRIGEELTTEQKNHYNNEV